MVKLPRQISTAATQRRRKAVPPLNATLQFMRWLWAIDHGLQSLSKRMRTTIGLTGPQRLVVRVLGRASELSAGELAAVLHVHQSTLTAILERLEQDGIVSRVSASDDRRRAVLSLTADGRALDRAKRGTVEAAVRRALVRVSPSAVAATVRVLSAVAHELEQASRDRSARPRRTR